MIPISGDCGDPGLGIGESDRDLLAENVSVIFHLAATIKFDEPLRSVKVTVIIYYFCYISHFEKLKCSTFIISDFQQKSRYENRMPANYTE